MPKQQQIIDEGEISVDQTLDYDDETTNTTDDEIGKINQQLQSYCQDQNIDLIQHGNLQAKHLTSYGVHHNRTGNSIFAKNLIGYFNKDSGN